MIKNLTPEEIAERKKQQAKRKKLEVDFKRHAVLEVLLSSGKWCSTTYVEFRSWDGKRRVNGKSYEGPVYLYGTNKLKKK